MIWLASFPRSGNTFFRNILHEVYGIASSTFHADPSRPVDQNYQTYPVVKTHLLPSELIPNSPEIKSVYLVRDGRDSMVSISHHRKDIVEPGTDFYNNMIEAILAQHGSYFGGWSENVNQWIDRADIIIKYEDLIVDPIYEVEKLRSIMDLPQPQVDKLPTFKDLKFGNPTYGAGHGHQFEKGMAQLNFRKGKSGSWNEEMPPELEELFWSRNHRIMTRLGYERGKPNIKHQIKRILIEASKYYSLDNDGIKRYIGELLQNIPIILEHQPSWEIDLLVNNHIKSLIQSKNELKDLNLSNFETPEETKAIWGKHRYEMGLLHFKKFLHDNLNSGIYDFTSKVYRSGPFRKILDLTRYTMSKINFPQNKKDFANKLASYDLIHIPLPQAMDSIDYLKLTEKSPSSPKILTTVHDLTHHLLPQYHTKENIRRAEKGMKSLLGHDGHAIAISRSTKEDLIREYQMDPGKIHQISQSANSGIFNRKEGKNELIKLRKKYNLPNTPYFLCLSTIEPRKNLINTIRGFLLFKKINPEQNICLVICGRKGWKFKDVFKEKKTQPKDIYFTGFVDDLRLPMLYRQARALCYISHYEGFGLPLLEAMACGTPTIYGNNSSMPEVVQDTGLAADSERIESIAHQMKIMATDDDLRTEKSEAAWRRANEFTWMKTTLETLEVYKKIIEQ